MSAEDIATWVIAICIADTISEAADAVRRFRKLRGTLGVFPEDNFATLLGLREDMDPVEVLSRLIEQARRGAFHPLGPLDVLIEIDTDGVFSVLASRHDEGVDTNFAPTKLFFEFFGTLDKETALDGFPILQTLKRIRNGGLIKLAELLPDEDLS